MVPRIRRSRARGFKFLSDTNPLGVARCRQSWAGCAEARLPIMTRVRWSGRRLLTRAERPPRWPDTLAGALPNVSFSLVSHHSAARTVTITIYARVLSVTDGAHARIRPQARMTAMRTAGPRLRRIFDSSCAPPSNVPTGCPGSSRTITSPGFGTWLRDRGRTGARSRRARAASQLGSQHGNLGELLGRAVAVLG